MRSLKQDSSSSSHNQQQPPTSLQHRKPYESGDIDQEQYQSLHDSNGQEDQAINPSDSDQPYSTPTDTSGQVTEKSRDSSTSNPAHAKPTHSVAQEKPLTKSPFSPGDARSSTSPARRTHSDHLTTSDLASIAIALSPALLHLWGRCFAQTSIARQIGTWFALLTLPLSAPLYRWETLPHFARDMLELMSYGSAVTVTVDITVVAYRYMMEHPPVREWEWLIFYPGVVAALVSWSVVVGFLWAFVVV